jgi:meiotic recombination protein SPO11
MSSKSSSSSSKRPLAAAAAASSANPRPNPPVSKRRIVNLADDANEVLAQCRKLRDELRQRNKSTNEKVAAQSSTINSNNDDGISKLPSYLLSSGDEEEEWDPEDSSDTNDNGGGKKKAKAAKKSSSSVKATTDNDTNDGPTSTTALMGSKNKTQTISLAQLKQLTSDNNNMKQVVEVVEMNTTEVMEGIENVAISIAQQIMYTNNATQKYGTISGGGSGSGGTAIGGGFQLDIPSRASSNQIYIPELDRIVLGNKLGTRSFLNVKEARKTAITTRVLQLLHAVLYKRIHITKRDLFYTDVKLFVDQTESDGVLDDVATMIGCTRSNLHVVASDKGLVVGRITFYEDGDYIDCTKMGVGGKAIPPYIDKIENITSDAEFILLVEKEAAYMRMAEDRFYMRYPCIVITAKGQPDVASRMFLSRIASELSIPVLALVDSDPYGLKILSVYMSGSKNMSYDSASLTTPDIKWLGLRPSDLNKYDLPEQCRLKMTENDIKTGKELLQEAFIMKNPEWMKELQTMVKSKEKAEIQALSSFGFQYVTEVYLPRKLKEGDWI